MSDSIDFTSSYVTVEDITDRVDELRSDRDSLIEDRDAAVEAYKFHDADDTRSTPEYADMVEAAKALAEWEEENKEELEHLEEVLEELCGNGGDHQWDGSWYPQSLIAEHEFESAMDELIDDIGEIPKDLPSYLTVVIDYAALRMDYTSIDIKGHSFLYR